jgi:hypothetical protein
MFRGKQDSSISPLAFRYRLFQTLTQNRDNARRINPAAQWIPDFAAALTDWQTRWQAAALLMDIGAPQATKILTASLPDWINTLKSQDSSERRLTG